MQRPTSLTAELPEGCCGSISPCPKEHLLEAAQFLAVMAFMTFRDEIPLPWWGASVAFAGCFLPALLDRIGLWDEAGTWFWDVMLLCGQREVGNIGRPWKMGEKSSGKWPNNFSLYPSCLSENGRAQGQVLFHPIQNRRKQQGKTSFAMNLLIPINPSCLGATRFFC